MILDAMLDHRAVFLLAVTAVLVVVAGIAWLWRRARPASRKRER